MILPYYMRLLCLCLATFFAIHCAAWLAVRGLSAAMLRLCVRLAPRTASSLLFGLRMAPCALALLVVLGYCVPSYVWLEPDIANERVGLAFLAAALFGMIVCVVPLVRGFRALLRTRKYLRTCAPETCAEVSGFVERDVVVVDDDTTLMAATGILRAKVLVSRTVLEALTGDQTEVALRHEAAHSAAARSGNFP